MPTEKMLYREIQAYRQNPLIYLVLAILTLVASLFVYLLKQSEYASGVGLGLLFLVLALIAFGKITTTVTETAVYLRYLPLVPQYRISFHQIKEVYRQEINPIADFGGYGLRVRGRTRAVLIQGSSAVAFLRHSGSTFLLGSQEPEKLHHVCQQILNRLNSST
jgi:hypothetical protein